MRSLVMHAGILACGVAAYVLATTVDGAGLILTAVLGAAYVGCS